MKKYKVKVGLIREKYFTPISPCLKVGMSRGLLSGAVAIIMHLIMIAQINNQKGNLTQQLQASLFFSPYLYVLCNIFIAVVLNTIFYITRNLLKHIIKKIQYNRVYSINPTNSMVMPLQEKSILEQQLLLKHLEIYYNAFKEMHHYLNGASVSVNSLRLILSKAHIKPQSNIEIINICCNLILKNLIDNALKLNEISNGKIEFKEDIFDLDLLLKNILSKLKCFTNKKQINIYYTLQLNPQNRYIGYQNLLYQILLNVLIEKIKTSNSTTEIHLAVFKEMENIYNSQIIFILYELPKKIDNTSSSTNNEEILQSSSNELLGIITSTVNTQDKARMEEYQKKITESNNLETYMAGKLTKIMAKKSNMCPTFYRIGKYLINNSINQIEDFTWLRVFLQKNYRGEEFETQELNYQEFETPTFATNSLMQIPETAASEPVFNKQPIDTPEPTSSPTSLNLYNSFQAKNPLSTKPQSPCASNQNLPSSSVVLSPTSATSNPLNLHFR